MNSKYRSIYIILSFFLISMTSDLHSQPKVFITLHQPPPNQLSVGDVWKMTLDNRTSAPLNVYLMGTVDKDDDRIVEGRSANISLPPGKSNYNYRSFETGSVNWTDNTLKEFILRTNSVPEGNYKTCITAYSTEGEIIVGAEACIFPVIIQPPGSEILLISPVDGEVLSDSLGINFIWQSTITGGKLPSYHLKIVEITGNQSSEAAMEKNRTFYEAENINTNSFYYPESAPKFVVGKEYVWMISRDNVKSEALGFKISNEEPVVNTDGLRAPQSSCCSFNTTTPTNSSPLPCTNSTVPPAIVPVVGYKINLPGFTTTGTCVGKLYYKITPGTLTTTTAAGFTGPVTAGATILNIPTLTAGSYTMFFKLICIDGLNVTSEISTYYFQFTVNPPIAPNVSVCDLPTGNINKGCGKTFNVTVPSTACNNSSISFPSACHTSYYYMICRANATPPSSSYPVATVGTYPALTTFTGVSPYPSTTCLTSINAGQWYQIPISAPATNYTRTISMPENLPAISGSDKYYVICYIANPCCFKSGYVACPGFKILQTTYPVVSRIVCSPSSSPPTDYNQCCEKIFTLKKLCSNTGPTGIQGATYHWIILKSSSAVYPGDPPCWASVTNNLTLATCPGATMTNGTWYKWGTSTPTITAPLLPASTDFYYVTCYIQICNPAYPNANSQFISGFAAYQKFQVMNPTAPTPVITWSDPLATSTPSPSPSSITTVTRFIPPSLVNFTLSVSGLPSTGTNTYQWYDNNVAVGTSPTYNVPNGTHSINVYTTSTISNSGSNFLTPGCRVKSDTVIVKILNCPGSTACDAASLDGVSVKTQLNNAGPITTKTVDLGTTPEILNYVSAIQNTTGSCNIDFGSNYIKFVFNTPNSSARFDGASLFTFTNIKPPKIGNVQPIICRVDVINHLAPYSMNMDPIITFTDNTISCQFASNSVPYYYITYGNWIQLDIHYACQ